MIFCFIISIVLFIILTTLLIKSESKFLTNKENFTERDFTILVFGTLILSMTMISFIIPVIYDLRGELLREKLKQEIAVEKLKEGLSTEVKVVVDEKTNSATIYFNDEIKKKKRKEKVEND